MKHVRKVLVKNQSGLHMRPASEIVKLLKDTKSRVFFTHKSATVNAKSLLGILTLTAEKNAAITITAEGSDAEDAVEMLAQAFEKEFEEIK